MQILIAGDKCSYNLDILNFVFEGLVDYSVLFVADFSISSSALNLCLSKRIELKVFTTKIDAKKQFELDTRVKEEYLYIKSSATSYTHRVLDCYKVGVDVADCVLFLAFSNRSYLMSVAEYAIEQGKHTFTIPGNINNRYCSGSNFLIKTGNAILIENSKEIINYIKS